MMTSGLSARLGEKGWIESFAEPGAERHLLVDRDVLVAQHDHFVVDQRVVDDLELRGAERPPEIDAFDLSADEAVDGLYADFRRGALAALPPTGLPCFLRLFVGSSLAPMAALRNGPRVDVNRRV